MTDISSVCVFCGARSQVPQGYLDAGAAFGARVAKRGLRLVYGGGDCGMMGAVADAALAGGGQVTGVFPRSLKNLEPEHARLSEIILVDTMHERKRIMFERSDAIAVLPGGFGTLDEMFEVITWKLLGFHAKPIVIFNHQGYWVPLLALMDNMMDTGFARKDARALYTVADTLEAAMDALVA